MKWNVNYSKNYPKISSTLRQKNSEFIESLKRNSHYKDWRYFIDGILKYGYDWHLFLSLLLLEIDLSPVQVMFCLCHIQ